MKWIKTKAIYNEASVLGQRCWHCTREFIGYGHKYTLVEVGGTPRPVHNHCAVLMSEPEVTAQPSTRKMNRTLDE